MIKRTLYFGNPAYLAVRHDQLLIDRPDHIDKATVPIEDIGVVLLDNPRITVTQTVLRRLLESNVALISCDDRHLPQGLLLPMEGHSAQTAVQRYQMEASIPLKKRLWQQTVISKIRNQAEVLRHCGKDFRRLRVHERRVESGDPKNVEGQAASWYWKILFRDFVRDRYGGGVNDLLNYGYAILRAMTARALVGSGLMPTLGIFHSNKYNAFGLADDIMEPYRPFVDLLVVDMLKEIEDDELELSKPIKAKLLSLATLDAKFGRVKRPLMTGMSITSASLAECYKGTKRKIIYPEFV